MRVLILAGVTALAVVVGMSTSATASDHRGAGHHHGRHSHHTIHGDGQAAVRPGGGSHTYTDLGPLGMMFGPPPGRHSCGPNCVPGASISAWSY